MATEMHRLSLTRRRLLLGATAIAANALVTACGGGSSATNTPPPAPSPTTAPTPILATAIPPTAVPAATATLVPPTVAPTVAPTIVPTTPPTVAATPAATASLSAQAVTSRLATTTTAPTLPLIVFAGAGATNGAGLPPLATYPTQTIALLAPAQYDAVNLGMAGPSPWTLAIMNDQAPTNIDPLYAASRSKNIVVLFDFHNDLYTGVSVEETFARLVTFCQARRKVGFKVVIGTLTPGEAIPPVQGRPSQDYEPVRQGVNTLIRTNLASFADALADVGADPTIGAPGAAANTKYFQRFDYFRLTPQGASIVAEIVKTAILTL
ncbi:MAG: hypothetical protein ACYDAR_07270 [Thermomicrobiales bacterium]